MLGTLFYFIGGHDNCIRKLFFYRQCEERIECFTINICYFKKVAWSKMIGFFWLFIRRLHNMEHFISKINVIY